MKTQIQKIKEKAWLNGFDVTEAINHKGNRKGLSAMEKGPGLGLPNT